MRILRNFLTPRCLSALFLLFLFSCASAPQKAPNKSTKATSEWNYDAIREARAAQDAQEASLPPQVAEDEKTLDCIILSANQIKSSRAIGCKALDPRAGYGEDKFCCGRDN